MLCIWHYIGLIRIFLSVAIYDKSYEDENDMEDGMIEKDTEEEAGATEKELCCDEVKMHYLSGIDWLIEYGLTSMKPFKDYTRLHWLNTIIS